MSASLSSALLNDHVLFEDVMKQVLTPASSQVNKHLVFLQRHFNKVLVSFFNDYLIIFVLIKHFVLMQTFVH